MKMNKKIILCFVVVVLTMIICVVPSFAYQGVFAIDADSLTGYNDLQVDADSSDFNYAIRYTLEVPFYDYNNSVSIDAVEISSVDGDISAACYSGIDSVYFTDAPDIEAYAGLVNYVVLDSSGLDITSDMAMELFVKVFYSLSVSAVEYSPIESVLTIFGGALSWLPSAVLVLVGIFWTGSSLTPIGVLSVAGLAIGVILLIFSIISRFLKFRG